LPALGDNAVMDSVPKGKRRWFQFSLRSLVLFTLICAVPCAWLGRKIEQKRRERVCVAAVLELGGEVKYDYEAGGPRETPPGPAWLRSFLGENFFSDVVGVTYQPSFWYELLWPKLADDGLAQIKSLTRLETLELSGTKTTDAGLANLKELTQLQELGLCDTKITDAGLVNLKGLTGLRNLDLNWTLVTHAGLANLKGLTRLHKLSLRRTKVGDAGIVNLQGLSELQDLDLIQTQVTDAGLANLNGLAQLQNLWLYETKVTATGIEDLQKALPNCKIHH
jgi:hypothetical protein